MSTYHVERLAPGFKDARTFNTKAKAIAWSQNCWIINSDGVRVRLDVSIRRIAKHG